MNIGLLGGTFDPVHNGHLHIAEEARCRLNLGKIILLPAGNPQLREGEVSATPAQRLEMLALAASVMPCCEVSDMEIKRKGPTFTVDTVAEIKETLDSGDELFFILGWDNVSRLPEWHEVQKLVEMCYLVAAPRPNSPKPDIKKLEELMPGVSERIMLMDRPLVNISSSDVRERIRHHLSVRHLVPEAVNQYIKDRGLYIA